MAMKAMHFLKASHHHPVVRNTGLTGLHSGVPGVTAVVQQNPAMGWCLLADHPMNQGVSVTNGARDYIDAVCQALGCDIDDLAWYELDSEGAFDQILPMQDPTGFAPILEDKCEPRSLHAFTTRVRRLPGGLPPETAAQVELCRQPFLKNETP